MYEYWGKIVHIVDGDTWDAEISCGFSITVKHRLRLHGFDTPEVYRPKSPLELEAGRRASAFAKKLLLGKRVLIRTHKLGIYGRYEAEVFIPWCGQMVSFGELLNRYGLLKHQIAQVPRSRIIGI